MQTTRLRHARVFAPTALVLIFALFSMPVLIGCSGQSEPPPPVDDSGFSRAPSSSGAPAAQENTGMSTKKKLVILAGAAALYYLYKKNKAAHESGNTSEPQYYLSKNGRVYYRDAEHRAHWVTPPTEGIQVSDSEAQEYREFQGYNNQSTGRDLMGLGTEPDDVQ